MKDKGIKITKTIKKHIVNNKKEYIIVILLFVIGIFLGVLFVNNIKEDDKYELQTYLNNYIEKMKALKNIDNISLLKNSIIKNIIIATIIWFFGTTIIRNTYSVWNCYL